MATMVGMEDADLLGIIIMPSRTMTRWSPPSSGVSPLTRAEGNGSSPPNECSPSLQRKLPPTLAIARGLKSPSPSVGPTSGRTYPTWGVFPLVLDVTVQKVLFRKVLVDDGSALNLLFAEALRELGLGITDLTPSDSSFWGVVPGKASRLLGEITLLV